LLASDEEPVDEEDFEASLAEPEVEEDEGCDAEDDEVSFDATEPELPLLPVLLLEAELGEEELPLLARLSLLLAERPVGERLSLELEEELPELAVFIELVSEDAVELGLELARFEFEVFEPEFMLADVSEADPLVLPVPAVLVERFWSLLELELSEPLALPEPEAEPLALNEPLEDGEVLEVEEALGLEELLLLPLSELFVVLLLL